MNIYPVSIILPTYNEDELLGRVLRTFVHQTYPCELMEIIVIDDCSEIPTNRFIPLAIPIAIKYIRHDINRGRAAARNSGIRASSHDLLIFLDSDIIPDKNLIESHVRSYKKDEAHAALGTVRWHNDVKLNHFTRYCKWFEYDTVLDKPTLDFTDFAGANFSTSKIFLAKNNIFFDEQFTAYGMEDLEFGYRLQQAGAQFSFVHDAIGLHCRQATLEEQTKRARQSAKSIIHFLNTYPGDASIFSGLHLVSTSVYETHKDIVMLAQRYAEDSIQHLNGLSDSQIDDLDKEQYAVAGTFLIEHAPYNTLVTDKNFSQRTDPTCLTNSFVDRAYRVVLLHDIKNSAHDARRLFDTHITRLKDSALQQSLCHEAGRYYILAGKPQEAQKILEQGLLVDAPQGQVYFLIMYLLGSIHKNQNNYRVASRLFGTIIREGSAYLHASQYASALFHAGQIILSMNQSPSEAKLYFSKALEIYPDHRSARKELMECA